MTINQQLFHQLIRDVGQDVLLPRFGHVTGSLKADGSIVTEADLLAQERLVDALLRLYPGSVVLGEEMSAGDQQRCFASDQPLWCVDPLDGTSNFAAGIPYFSISVALIEKGRVILGAVYDPVRDELFHTDLTSGAMLNDVPLPSLNGSNLLGPLALSQSIALVDFKRLSPSLAARMAGAPPYKSQRSFGSVALDWCWLTTNRVQVYLHGRANIWDYAAGHFIFQQAGGSSCTLEGEPVYSAELKGRSCVAAVNSKLFEEWVCYLK
ncbi:MAG: inositol monophosphatase family protein [Gammaproteobacteria bacterium]|nr:inositol monophosphatase family protein [Gammaproteobacteria bacterium]